jgi:colanic acid biosynthesis glycosyl transferase WcaI
LFGEFLDERGFVAALFDADVFVITETQGVGASFIPSKLIPGMASGTPVVCVCDGQGPLGQEVREHGLGMTVEWPELETLWPRLAAVLDDPQQFATLQQNCLRRAQAYGRDPVVEHVEREPMAMVRRPKAATAQLSA